MSHRADRAVPYRTRRTLAVIAGVMAGVTVVLIAVLWPRGERRGDLTEIGVYRDVYAATVVSSTEQACQNTVPSENIRCRFIVFELTEGPDRGTRANIDFPTDSPIPPLDPGDEAVLGRTPQARPGFQYAFVDRERGGVLLWLGLAFAAAVVALGRLRGFAALAGLAASLAVLLAFILPALVEGKDPLLIAVVGAAAIAFLALYLAHGLTTMTTVALLGTLGSLALTAILANVFVGLAELTGFVTEESTIVRVGAAQIDLAGLTLAGVVIGALGAIDDVTVTQASAVWELRDANPRMPSGELLRAGLRIGRDHVASTVNTLALAYAGASMPLLILFVLSGQSIGSVANGETVATEIVRTLVGSIGLVASVPITTWLAVQTARPRGRRA
ncbi:MAG TPA: YibE/F family protein [Actinomycetota bacterium]|nr:YibE/F family protein [Actinomycetota bacterium]